jgi:hypothetical protein
MRDLPKSGDIVLWDKESEDATHWLLVSHKHDKMTWVMLEDGCDDTQLGHTSTVTAVHEDSRGWQIVTNPPIEIAVRRTLYYEGLLSEVTNDGQG